jgi:hypothetical protein
MRSARTRSVVVFLLLSVVIGLAAPALAGNRRHDRPDNWYLGLAEFYPSVGFVNTTTHYASGVLIAPEWVLTAAHVCDVAEDKPTTVTFDGTAYTVDGIYRYADFDYNPWAGNDIGLFHLESTVEGIRPATRYRGYRELGQTAVISGYGLSGTGLQPNTITDFRQRAGTNRVDLLLEGETELSGLLMVDFDKPRDRTESLWDPAVPSLMEFLPSRGDSGGGLFLWGQLAGIISFGHVEDGTADCDYGDAVGLTRVSPFNGWIDEIIYGSEAPAGPGPWPWPWRRRFCDQDADPAGTGLGDGEAFSFLVVPEPATIGLLAAGALALLRRNRKRQ